MCIRGCAPGWRGRGIECCAPSNGKRWLINPEQFYDKLLKPSLGALFVSQLIVFLVFPLYRRGLRWLPLVAIASGLVAWGFYTLVAGSVST